MIKTIEIVISPRGEARLETKGFAGNSCQTASQSLEESLGMRQSEQLTTDFYNCERSHAQARGVA